MNIDENKGCDGMKKKLYLTFILIFVAATFLHYISNYNIISKPPSDKWAKHVKLAEGKIKSNPKILKYKNDEYLIAFDDGDRVRLIIFDKLGEIKLEKELNAMDEMVRNLSLMEDGNNFYVSWIISNGGIKSLIKTKLDEELKVINTTQYFDIVDSSQIGDDLLVISYSDKIGIEDLTNSRVYEINEKAATHLAGAKSKDTILLTYILDETEFKFVKISDGKIIKNDIGTVGKGVFDTFGDLLPSIISNFYVGSILCIVISILSLIYGYNEYKNNIYESPFMPFSKALIIDTILTQTIFVPFII